MKVTRSLLSISVCLTASSVSAFTLPANISMTEGNLTPPLNTSLQFGRNGMPDPRFSIITAMQGTLIPVQPTLLNILYFMGLAALHSPTDHLIPRKYSAPGYEEVTIKTFVFTEARFLLWGIYLAVVGMLESARFHNTQIELFWGDESVGRIEISAVPGLALAGQSNETTSDSSSDLKRSASAPVSTSSNTSDPAEDTEHGTSAENFILSSTTLSSDEDTTFLAEFAQSWTTPSTNSSALPPFLSATGPLSVGFGITLSAAPAAQKIKRNGVFTMVYAALLNVAQHPPGAEVESFATKWPEGKLVLNMEGSDAYAICLYGRAINVLTYVPRYMAEHPNFGFKEAYFQAVRGQSRLCSGSVLKSIL